MSNQTIVETYIDEETGDTVFDIPQPLIDAGWLPGDTLEYNMSSDGLVITNITWLERQGKVA